MVHVTRPKWILNLIRALYLLLPLVGYLTFTWWVALIGIVAAYIFDITWTKWATGLSWDNFRHMIGVLHRPRNIGHYVVCRINGRKIEIITSSYHDRIHLVYKIPVKDWPEIYRLQKEDQTLGGLVPVADIDDRHGHHWLCMDTQPELDRQVELFKSILDSADAELSSNVYAKSMIIAKDVWGSGPGEGR